MKKTVTILGSVALFGVVSLAIANNTPKAQETQDPATEQAFSAEDNALSAEDNALSAEAEIVGSIANGVMDNVVDKGYAPSKQKAAVANSKIIEKAFQAFVDNNYDPAEAVDKAAEVAVEQGWVKSKADAKRQLRRTIEKARKDESLINKFYKALGI